MWTGSGQNLNKTEERWKVRLLTLASVAIFVSLCSFAGAGGTLAVTRVAGPSVTKVEPPSWWAGHSINPVRLLVRGRNLSGARVKAIRPQTVPSDVRINPSGTYLFVNVNVSGTARPGDYPLFIETLGGRTTIPFRVDAPLSSATNFRGISSDD